MAVINAFGALGGFAGAYIVGALGGGTKSGAAFIFMAASLLAAGLLMFLVKRPRVATAATPRAARSRAAAGAPSPHRGVLGRPLPDGGPLSTTRRDRPRKR